jgi:hypothetical protein
VSDKEHLLAAAGLTARPANTPQRTASLHTLPSNKFISKSKGDRIENIHADPTVCNCLYEGDQLREKSAEASHARRWPRHGLSGDSVRRGKGTVPRKAYPTIVQYLLRDASAPIGSPRQRHEWVVALRQRGEHL